MATGHSSFRHTKTAGSWYRSGVVAVTNFGIVKAIRSAILFMSFFGFYKTQFADVLGSPFAGAPDNPSHRTSILNRRRGIIAIRSAVETSRSTKILTRQTVPILIMEPRGSQWPVELDTSSPVRAWQRPHTPNIAVQSVEKTRAGDTSRTIEIQ